MWNNIYHIKLDDGTILSNPKEIWEAWGQYFKKRYTPKDGGNYDAKFRSFVESRMTDLAKESVNEIENIWEDPFTD